MMMTPTSEIERTVWKRVTIAPETETRAAVAIMVSAGGMVVATKNPEMPKMRVRMMISTAILTLEDPERLTPAP